MPHFSMPPVRITVSVRDESHTALDVETRLVVKGDPCERQNGTNMGSVTFVSQSEKNAFVLPPHEFKLDDDYEAERLLRAPALLLRLVGPGNMIPNSTERPYQHIFSQQIPVEQMMRCFDQGETLTVHAHTLEDGRKFDISLELGDNSRKSKADIKIAMGVIKDHIAQVTRMHGQPPMYAADIVKQLNGLREDRHAKTQRVVASLGGHCAIWDLNASRSFANFKVDPPQANRLRQAAVKENLSSYAQEFVLVIAGMLSVITQKHNGDMNKLLSVSNALESWFKQGKEAIKCEFITAVQHHVALTSVYQSDPGWVVQNHQLVIGEAAAEDQELTGGWSPEAILNQTLFGMKCRGADCEDMVAMILAIIEVVMRPRTDLVTAVNRATNSLPKIFHSSPAAADYTFHGENLITLSLGIRDAFNSEPRADLEMPIPKSQEHFLQMLAQGAQQQGTQSTEMSICSILARGQSLSPEYRGSATALATMADYESDWKSKVTDGNNGQDSGYIGHAVGMEMTMRPFAKIGGLTINLVDPDGLRLIEGTTPACNIQNNTACKINLCADESRTTATRMAVQSDIDGMRPYQINTVMASNISSTILTNEFNAKLKESEIGGSTTATQVFQLFTDGFYKCKLSGEKHPLTFDIATGASMPGFPLDTNLRGTRTVAIDSGVSNQEERLLNLLGGTMASMRLGPAQMSSVVGPSSLNPLQARMVMDATTEGANPTRPGDLGKVPIGALTTGCVLKNAFPNDTSTSLEVKTKRIATDVHRVFGPTSTVMNGPFAGGMIVSSVV
jgi:hypothetical protein